MRAILFLLLMNISLLGFAQPVSNGDASAQTRFSVFEASISEIQTALEQGRISSVELVQQYLARIDAYDQQGPALNSIIRVNLEALAIAAALDGERVSSGPRSDLHGVPIVIKDNYNTDYMPTTGGSVALADFIPSVNATQVDKLMAAGAIILAKTNLHEYAYGITTVSSLQGQTRNPYDIRRAPGGSSGGTAAAVAASFAAIGMGSDTCGSIRIPAAFNNLIGLRPSKGLSSIYGVMPLSHTQDTAGPLARSVEDLAIVLDIVSGFDPNDEATQFMRSAPAPRFREQLATVDLKGLRIGKLKDYFERADGAARRVIEQALDWYEEQGAEVFDVDIPELGALIGRSGVIGHEFEVDLNQYLSLFLSESILNLNDIVDLGLYHRAVNGPLTRSRDSVFNQESYGLALAARSELRAAVEQLFVVQDLDVIVYPPIAELQAFIGEPQPGNNCSISANSGLPALSIPAGFTANGLPVGMEILGRFLDDARLLAIAYPYEQSLSVRQAPAVTPPLLRGEAPPPIEIALLFDQQGVAMEANFSFNITDNSLRYRVLLDEANAVDVFAVTLVIDEEEGFELNDPVVLNLLGPDASSGAGDYFMTPQFRRAFIERRVYLKVFASDFPTAGLSQRVN